MILLLKSKILLLNTSSYKLQSDLIFLGKSIKLDTPVFVLFSLFEPTCGALVRFLFISFSF